MAGLIFTASFAISAPVNGSSPERWIREYFDAQRPGTAMRLVARGNQDELEICFDQCDIFQRSKLSQNNSAPSEKFWEFVFLFEHAKGVGADYSAFRDASHSVVADFVRRNSLYCHGNTGSGDPNPPFSCNWNQWAAVLRLRIGEATYDEGMRCIAWRSGRAMTTMRQRCTKAFENPWKSHK